MSAKKTPTGSIRGSNWKGYSKRRCSVEGCKKRAREFIDGKPYCKKHRKWI